MFKYIKVIGIVIILIVVIAGTIILCMLNNITVRQTKDYAVMYVDAEDIVDAKVMISPPEKYLQLLQIDFEMRKQVAEYMENNNLKLKPGKQEFVRNNPTFKELVEDGFVFEMIV